MNETTNGTGGETNGIHAESPLDVEPPESDAIAHARWRWKHRPEESDAVVMSEYNCNLLMSDLDAIADMVERNYVRRGDYDFVVEMLNCMKAERDELSDKIGEITDEASELMKKQPYTFDVHDAPGSLRTVGRYIDELKSRHCPHYHVDRHYCDVHETRIKALTAERDEWKKRYDSVLEGRNHWSGIVDDIYRRIYPREEYCMPNDPTDMINKAIDAIERERDEAIEAYDKHLEAHDAWHEPEDIKYTRNRFSVLEKAKNERIAKLEAERDELKAKVDDIMDEPDYREAWERMHKERDEWKEKAEGFTEALEKLGCSVLANGTVFGPTEAKSAKRAAAVERLKANPSDDTFEKIIAAAIGCTPFFITTRKTREMLIDLLSDENVGIPYERPRIIDPSEIEAMVENANSKAGPPQPATSVDAQRDTNETCPDAMGQSSTHSKAQSKDAPSLSQLFGILSDDCGQIADMSQKSADCVRSEPEMSGIDEPDTIRNELEDNGYELDSREKLEADIEDYLAWEYGCTPGALNVYFDWLDRQASITHQIDAWNIERLERERDYWKQEVQNCLDCAYPQSHSPEVRYAPEVMCYPRHDGFTTPSTLVCDVIDGMRDTLCNIANFAVNRMTRHGKENQ